VNFYAVLTRVSVSPGTPVYERHSGHRSLTDPDATPKSSQAPRMPWRRSRRAAPYTQPGYDRKGPAVRDLRALEALVDLTERHQADSLTACRRLYAPELLKGHHE
jgi:hypothetical protein